MQSPRGGFRGTSTWGIYHSEACPRSVRGRAPTVLQPCPLCRARRGSCLCRADRHPPRWCHCRKAPAMLRPGRDGSRPLPPCACSGAPPLFHRQSCVAGQRGPCAVSHPSAIGSSQMARGPVDPLPVLDCQTAVGEGSGRLRRRLYRYTDQCGLRSRACNRHLQRRKAQCRIAWWHRGRQIASGNSHRPGVRHWDRTNGTRDHFCNVVDLVNRLETETETETRSRKQARLADYLNRRDVIHLPSRACKRLPGSGCHDTHSAPRPPDVSLRGRRNRHRAPALPIPRLIPITARAGFTTGSVPSAQVRISVAPRRPSLEEYGGQFCMSIDRSSPSSVVAPDFCPKFIGLFLTSQCAQAQTPPKRIDIVEPSDRSHRHAVRRCCPGRAHRLR